MGLHGYGDRVYTTTETEPLWPTVRRPVSADAKRVFDLIGDGGLLRIPFDDAEPASVVRRQFRDGPAGAVTFPFREELWRNLGPDNVILTSELLEEVLATGMLGILTRKRYFYKIGWEECGVDGTRAEFWCLVQ